MVYTLMKKVMPCVNLFFFFFVCSIYIIHVSNNKPQYIYIYIFLNKKTSFDFWLFLMTHLPTILNTIYSLTLTILNGPFVYISEMNQGFHIVHLKKLRKPANKSACYVNCEFNHWCFWSAECEFEIPSRDTYMSLPLLRPADGT